MKATRSLVATLAAAAALALCGAPSFAAEWEPSWGVSLGTPQWVSASAGVMIGEIERPPDAGKETHLPHGLLLQVEPGLGGGKASIGYAKGLLPYAAVGLKASILRTWGKPLVAEPRCTYLGVEAEAAFFIKIGIGVMARVAGTTDSPKVMVTGVIGIGF